VPVGIGKPMTRPVSRESRGRRCPSLCHWLACCESDPRDRERERFASRSSASFVRSRHRRSRDR